MCTTRIEAINTKESQDGGDYEPELLWKGQSKTISELTELISEKVCEKAGRLLAGYILLRRYYHDCL